LSWRNKPLEEDKVEFLMKNFDLSRMIAILISRMGMEDPRTIKRFLNPKLTYLQSPFEIPNLEQAVARLIPAIERKERIFVLGDYDVDGVTSTSIFVGIMRELGLDPDFSVPKRTDEGYGLSLNVVQEKVLGNGEKYDLVVALDCGSNDHDSIENLISNGIDVIVVDHHQIRGRIHPRVIFVNPHAASGENDSSKILCSVGLTFKLVQGLLNRLQAQGMQKSFSIVLKDYLDLVALGTLSDLVPLVADNRILVSHGLHRIGKSKHLGLQALMDVCSLPYGKDMDVADVSFKLGPRLNAGGRMADALTSVNLLLSNCFNTCVKYAHELDMLNQDRQSTERIIYDQAISYLSRRSFKDAVVLYDPDWHTGVVGIVSSRIARNYHIPVIVLGSEGGYARGSGRSIEEIDINEALSHCSEFLESWGGHPMAAGLSLRPENLEGFREAFAEAVSKQIANHATPIQSPEHLEVDAWIEASDITFQFMSELKLLGPFGVNNPEPVWGMNGALLASKVSRFGTDNFKFWVNLNGVDYDLMCLGWGFPSRVPESRNPLDLVFSLKWHEWKGRGYPQATVLDWRYSL
jgi:single-stranded-DNA-specific exonuclease